MKKHCTVFILLLTIFTSCENFLNNDINADPNNPIEVPIQNMLPSIQVHIADLYGGEYSRVNCALVQHVEGVARKGSEILNYTYILSQRTSRSWEIMYNSILNEIKNARELAEEQNLNAYLAIINILEAHALMMATDIWDDIPYTDALQGIQNLNPVYDSQESIYDYVFNLLDETEILILNNPGAVRPANDDMIFEGDLSKWLKTLNGIRARAHLRFKNYDQALNSARNAMDSSEDNFEFEYPGGEDASPWFRFIRDRTGDFELSPTLRSKMTAYDDPRINIFDNVFTTNHPYLTDDLPVELITYREISFIITECLWRINGSLNDEAYNSYLEGIRASFDHLNLEESVIEAYLNSSVVNTGQNSIGIDKIMDQKYFALFINPEVYTDYRRTELPFLVPTTGSTIPVRWNYPDEEYEFNENAPVEGSIDIFNDKVFWDLD